MQQKSEPFVSLVTSKRCLFDVPWSWANTAWGPVICLHAVAGFPICTPGGNVATQTEFNLQSAVLLLREEDPSPGINITAMHQPNCCTHLKAQRKGFTLILTADVWKPIVCFNTLIWIWTKKMVHWTLIERGEKANSLTEIEKRAQMYLISFY